MTPCRFLFYIAALLIPLFSNATVLLDDCPDLPPHTPKDIHDVAPSNIKVAMALGDSITAGFGMKGIAGGLYEYRQWSGLIGENDENVTTAYGILKHYAKDMVGGSVAPAHLVEMPGWSYHDSDRFNAAQSGAKVHDLFYQIDHLVDVVSKDPNVDMEKDYKLMNILIGANDVCHGCVTDPDQFSAEIEKQFEQVIEQIYKNFPRTIVNIIPLFNFSVVYEIDQKSVYCRTLHKAMKECSCLYGTDKDRSIMDMLTARLFQSIQKITQNWMAKQLDGFAVVYQPFTRGLTIPGTDYLSTLDCFHPSLYAHEQISIAGWNSLILPVGQKPTTFKEGNKIQCATKDSRIFV